VLDGSCGFAPHHSRVAEGAARRQRRRRRRRILLHFGWDPGAARTLYHYRGALLPALLRSEAVAASVRAGTPPRGVAVRVDAMRTPAQFSNAWRTALAQMGIRGQAADQLLRLAVEPFRSDFMCALRAHLMRPRLPACAAARGAGT